MQSPLLVTAAIIVRAGRVLLTLRPEGKRQPGYWEFPGGKMAAGEPPSQALEREIREELGIDIDVGRIYDVVYYRYPWGPVLILAYCCRIRQGTPKNLEVAEHRWVHPEHLHGYSLLPADLPLIARLTEEPASFWMVPTNNGGNIF